MMRALVVAVVPLLILSLIVGAVGCGVELDPTQSPTPEPTPVPTPATYYVDQGNPAASDSNSGTEASPWLTVGRAASTLVAGDTVYIKAGVYNEYVINPANSGTAGNYITYQAYPGDEAAYNPATGVYSGVWVDATGLVPAAGQWSAIMHIGRSGARSYIKISGLGFRNALDSHTWVMGICVTNSSNIIVQNNYCRNITSSGICASGGSNVTIDGNTLEFCQRGISPAYDGWGARATHENLTVDGTTNYKITNNHIFNSPGMLGRLGICVKDGANYGEIAYNTVNDIGNDGGIYVTTVTTGIHDIEIHHNNVFNSTGSTTGYGITIGSEGGCLAENISIHDNISHDNEKAGIAISSYIVAGFTDYGVHHVQIYNNTIYGNGSDGIMLERPTMVDVNTHDNIVYGNTYGIRYSSRAQEMSFSNNVDNNVNPVIPVALDGSVLAVTTNAATNVTTTSATLNGTLTGLGGAASVTVSFEIGLDTSYGDVVGTQTKSTTGSFSFIISSGLTANTTYHYRARAVAGGTTVYGADMTFTASTPTPTRTPSGYTLTVTSQGCCSVLVRGLPEGDKTVPAGSSVTLTGISYGTLATITAQTGYECHLNYWLIDGVRKPSNPQVPPDHTIYLIINRDHTVMAVCIAG